MKEPRLLPLLLWVAIESLMMRPAAGQIPPPNLPPPGGYQAIPNFTGSSAGLNFRGAINDRFDGTKTISPRVVSVRFINFPAEQDGSLVYCLDCAASIPCAAGGSGAWAFGAKGQWQCSATVPSAIA